MSDVTTRPKVFIVGGGFEYIRLMYSLNFDAAFNVETADVILFTGGEDVDPTFYGEKIMKGTHYNTSRDAREKDIFDMAKAIGIPMIGICRGGQFLNVMNGGKLYQHVDKHANGRHDAYIQLPPLVDGKPRCIEVTSTHHQMMIPPKKKEALIFMTAHISENREEFSRSESGKASDKFPDIEAVFFTDTNCLCFQPHPEFSSASPDLVDFFESCVEDWITPMIPTPQQKIEIMRTLTSKE